jgi:hypothetical protein
LRFGHAVAHASRMRLDGERIRPYEESGASGEWHGHGAVAGAAWRD